MNRGSLHARTVKQNFLPMTLRLIIRGLNENGVFDPVLAKQYNDELIANGEKGNLVNVLYPEKGEAWGVENGYGWFDESGVRQTFIGYYAHWGLWHGGTIRTALDALKNAYIYTGDVKYARTR